MPARSSDNRILIAGAGIGGLSAAIALARQGIESHVLERNVSFSGEGAGIQLGPNATRILDQLGVLDSLKEKSVVSEGIAIGDGLTGAHLATVPFGTTAEQRYGAPFLLVHRQDLHTALLKTAKALGGVKITMDCEAKSFEQFPGQVVLTTQKHAVRGRGFIVADGLWSQLRPQIDAGAMQTFAGKTAWRTLLAPKEMPDEFHRPWTGLWLAKNAHLVHYPVRGGKKFNVVAVINEPRGSRAEGWNLEADPDELYPCFEAWNERVKAIVRSGSTWRKWSLFYQPPLRTWVQGAVTLLGDAAHPVLPFLAQGGAMAIEDAAVLAEILVEYKGDPWKAFRHFEETRIERTARTSFESRRIGNIYHLGGVMRLARNFVLRSRSPQSLLKKFDWLYGFGADC